MPRSARKIGKSGTYHIMIRGNERKSIFLDDEDRLRFLDTLKEKSRLGEFVLQAFCLMDNHVHLIIFEWKDSVKRIMKRINTSYAYYFNKKYKRIGHVFQDRFKSEVIEDERHLLTAIRYVHNNPIKAGMVKQPDQYKWSSYVSYISQEQNSLLNPQDVLNLFDADFNHSIELFIEYSLQNCDEEFIECDEVKMEDNEEKAKAKLDEFLNNNKITIGQLKQRNMYKLRNELIKSLKFEFGLSIRQISSLVNIDRNIIQRVKNESEEPSP